MAVGALLGFLAGLYVAWNWWQQPEIFKDLFKVVHNKTSNLVETAKQKLKDSAEKPPQ